MDRNELIPPSKMGGSEKIYILGNILEKNSKPKKNLQNTLSRQEKGLESLKIAPARLKCPIHGKMVKNAQKIPPTDKFGSGVGGERSRGGGSEIIFFRIRKSPHSRGDRPPLRKFKIETIRSYVLHHRRKFEQVGYFFGLKRPI